MTKTPCTAPKGTSGVLSTGSMPHVLHRRVRVLALERKLPLISPWRVWEGGPSARVRFDDPDRLVGIGLAGIEVQDEVASVDHFPSPVDLLGLHVGVRERDRVLTGKRPIRP
jgi:hypothetical protein